MSKKMDELEASKLAEELAPCPFCTSKVLVLVEYEEGSGEYAVVCQSCEARGPVQPSMQTAVSGWDGSATGIIHVGH